jgi:patatin-like phospholipase
MRGSGASVGDALAIEANAMSETTRGDAPAMLSRDRHLFGPGPKRILSLDGGGVRGAITVAFLEAIEAELTRRHGPDAKLCDWFDLIGGTSTGAIIAGALALGFRASELRRFYLDLTPYVFKREFWRVPYLQAKFDARILRRRIEEVVGDRELASPDLRTGFCIFTKRMDTGSPWVLANNSRAPFWEDGADYLGNKHYRLANLVRASTAAPRYFDPEILRILPDPPEARPAVLPVGKVEADSAPPPTRPYLRHGIGRRAAERYNSKTHGIFVDGGVSPHGDPALGLFQMTQFERFGLRWPTGPDNLTVVSVGTGGHRPRLSFEKLMVAKFLRLGLQSLLSMMHDAQLSVLTQMQWMGQTATPWKLNSEILDLGNDGPPGGKMFRFLRYDVRLETDWLKDRLGIELGAREVERIRQMDDPTIVPVIYEIAQAAAKRHVRSDHWDILLSRDGGVGRTLPVSETL